MWLLTGFALGVIAGILLQKYYTVGRLLHSIGVYTSRATSSHALSSSLHARPEIPLTRLASQRVMVALAFGQSNAANFGENPRCAGAGVFNFYQGKLYAAHDPLLEPVAMAAVYGRDWVTGLWPPSTMTRWSF
jgi:hypothetical protein